MRNRNYFAGCSERLGFESATSERATEATGAGAIWFHAVSVGEVLSIVELLRRLHAERPLVHLFVSSTTLTGHAMATQKLAGIARGIFYAPLDYRSIVRRVLRRIRPSLVVVMETEIWPNLYRETKRAGPSLLIVNGRISDRALPSYERWHSFFRHVLCWPDAILTQADEDARRYILAGAPANRVRAAGNLKYDFIPTSAGIAPDVTSFLDTLAPGKIWIASSTMPPAFSGDIDEDDAVLSAFEICARQHPDLLLILVPRKPERFDLAARKLEDRAISYVRRTALASAPLNLPGVLLLDSMGELAALFARADVVFMGGTLAHCGGHNILEPAAFAKPVIVGPHMENFAAIAQEFQQANATRSIRSEVDLAPVVNALLEDPSGAAEMGARARVLAESKRGVMAKIAADIWHAYDEGVPRPLHTLTARLFFTPLSWAWRIGSRYRFKKYLAMRRSLHAPVVSIGGLTMGGVGKTPLVTHLAEKLHAAGRNPAILTRGYKRRSAEPIVLVARGKRATLDLTGDEAQLFIRSGHAHVGIASDRYEAGAKVEQEMAPDIFLLDDGFQHQKLARQHDIVLIDALDPFGGGVFPLGRGREPADALRRATILILTRADLAHPSTGLERELRKINPTAPIFRSRVVPRCWVNFKTGETLELSESGQDEHWKRAAAFCGLGNPRAFWATLDELQLEVTFRWAFGDHHSYKPMELERIQQQALATGVETLVTTEKDAINLPEGTAEVLAPLSLYWLKIGVEIEREEELLSLLS